MIQNESDELAQKLSNNLGKIGLGIMTVGLIILYYDAYTLTQLFPTNYHFYEHPEIYIPIVGMIVAFFGISIFIFNFSKGKKVI
jgi:hypothetical protein